MGTEEQLDLSEKFLGFAHAQDSNGQMPPVSMGICHIDDGQEGGQSPTMDDSQKEKWRKKLQDELRRRDLDMKKVSRDAKLGDTYVRDFLTRGRGKIENLRKISVALGHDADWLTSDEPSTVPGSAAPPPSRPSVTPNAAGITDPPRMGDDLLPVLGLSKGGDEGKFVFNGETLGMVPRPPILAGVPKAYATYVAGDSMYPRYKAGEQVWVHPTRPPARGDDVVIQVHPEIEGEPPEGYIKEFVAWTPTRLVLKQFNPAKEIEIDRQLVISVHLIVGSLKA